MTKPLIDHTDDELATAIRQSAERVAMLSYNDLIAERDRRVVRRQANATLVLSVVSLGIAAAAVVVAVLT